MAAVGRFLLLSRTSLSPFTSAVNVQSLSKTCFHTAAICKSLPKGYFGSQRLIHIAGKTGLQFSPAKQSVHIPSSLFHTLQKQIQRKPGTVGAFASGVRNLPTLNQIRRQKPRTKNTKPKPYIPRSEKVLLGPQRKGVCIKVFIRKPKKPNSAQRKCALLKLSNGKIISAYIPGEKGQLQEHGVVLFEGGRVQDCPGIKYKIIRGKLDMN